MAATFFEKPKEMMVLGIGIVSAKRDLLVASFVVKVVMVWVGNLRLSEAGGGWLPAADGAENKERHNARARWICL